MTIRSPRRAPIRAMRILGSLAILLGIALGPAGAQPASAEEENARQPQQSTRERVRNSLEREGAAASPAERRQELRALNEIHRELMPPGTTVPAPRLAPPSDTRSGGD